MENNVLSFDIKAIKTKTMSMKEQRIGNQTQRRRTQQQVTLSKYTTTRNGVLEKARTQTFYFKNIHQTVCLGL